MLGVSRTVTEVELKSAYRKLALQFHPDRNPNNPDAEEKFKEVSEAYAVLADTDKRAAYDRYGHAGLGGGAGQAAGFDPTVFQDFSDIFGEFFGFGDMFGGGGGGRRRSRVQRGADLREDLTLEFEEAFFGTESQVTVRRHEACEDCRGSGSAPGKGADDLPLLQRPRPGPLPAGILQHCPHLSHVPGYGQRHHRSLPEVQRRRPHSAAAHGRRQGSRRSGRRNAHSLFRRWRSGQPSAAPPEICTSCCT